MIRTEERVNGERQREEYNTKKREKKTRRTGDEGDTEKHEKKQEQTKTRTGKKRSGKT